MDTAPPMIERDRGTFIRFLIAGGMNTLFGWAVYSVALLLGADVWLALLSGMLVGMAFNFFSLGGYAFRDLSLQRIPKFITSYLLVYTLNLALIHWLQELVHSAVWAQLILTPIMAMISYFIMSYWVFNQSAKIKPI